MEYMIQRKYSLEKISIICRDLKKLISKKTFILLSGDLGVGKTTLAQNLLNLYGVTMKDVVSPTYAYSLIHSINGVDIAHIDMYRLEKGKFDQNIQSYIEDGMDLFIIEWPDRIGEELLKYIRKSFSCIDIDIKIVDDVTRLIKINDSSN